MKKKTDLQVMHEMAQNDSKGIMCSTTVTDANKVKQGGKITFGVSEDTFQKIAQQMVFGKPTHYVAMYVMEKQEFDSIKDKALEESDAEIALKDYDALAKFIQDGKMGLAGESYGDIAVRKIQNLQKAIALLCNSIPPAQREKALGANLEDFNNLIK